MEKDEVVCSIFKTYNYRKFKQTYGNREKIPVHIRRLIASFRNRYLICPVLVNEKFEVIDGQHRLQAAKDTENPVYYYIVPGYGIEEVTILNTNTINWIKLNYLETYCKQNKTNYVILKAFMDKYPEFGIRSVEILIGLSGKHHDTKQINGTTVNIKNFQEGKLVIPDIKKSTEIVEKILEFKPYFDKYYTSKFVSAVMSLINKSKFYNHKEMIQKVKTSNINFRVCNTTVEYKILLEEIFNYRRSRENKVSFRYE